MSDSCAVAHGGAGGGGGERTLVVVFAGPVGEYLLRYGADLGYRTVLVEPERGRVSDTSAHEVRTSVPRDLPEGADVLVTDHHRAEIGPVVRDALAAPGARVGVMGNARHRGPHVAALRALGVPEEEIGRVRRPIGLNIGSRTPPEIAISVLAGLVAERTGRPGGFDFPNPDAGGQPGDARVTS